MSSPVVVARWFCLLIGGFLLIRAATTLAGGANFTVPGDGWRSVLQLIVVAILAVGAARPQRAVGAVAVVGLLYGLEVILGLVGGDTILGLIPVDTRDRVVHPIIAILGLAVVFAGRRQLRTAEEMTSSVS